MKFTDEWWTSPQESDSGRLIMVTGRDSMQKAIDSGKYIYRVDVSWDYNSLPDGMPSPADANLMDEATEALKKEFAADPVGILTGIYTGDGRRDWIFYTLNLRIFGNIFNRALASLDAMPLHIEASEDRDWEEYREMKANTYIPPEEG